MEAERQEKLFSQSSLSSMTMLTSRKQNTLTTADDHEQFDILEKDCSQHQSAELKHEQQRYEEKTTLEKEASIAVTAPTTIAPTSQRKFDMGKLRDRWWSLLKIQRQKEELEAISTRQHKKHNQSTGSGQDGDADRRSASSSSSVSTSESYSDDDSDDTSPSSEVSGDDDESIDVKLDKYLTVEFPLHQAIINEDLTSISALLSWNNPRRVRANAFASRSALGLEEDNKNGCSSGSTTVLDSVGDALSPLQLAVYLD